MAQSKRGQRLGPGVSLRAAGHQSRKDVLAKGRRLGRKKLLSGVKSDELFTPAEGFDINMCHLDE